MVLQAVAGGGGYPKGQHAGKTNRPGGLAPTGNAARQADERGADARLGGRNPCDARKEAIPPQPARHRQTGKPQSKPGPPGDVIVRGCAAGVCRTVGGGQGDGGHGTDGRLMPGPVAQAAGQEEKCLKTAGCNILPPPTPSPADKNCHPNGNPSHKLSTPGRRSCEWNRADPYR